MKALFSNWKNQAVDNHYGVAFDSHTDEVVIAERIVGGGFQIWRVGRSESRAVNIAAGEARTAVLGWSAHTDRSQSISESEADDEAVLRALVEAAQSLPHAETSSFSWSRTPDRKITITQAERRDLERTVAQISPWLSAQVPPHLPRTRQLRVRVETVTRSIARLWLSEAGEHSLALQRTVAFVTAGREGYAIGLWSAETGLVYETEELFEADASPEMAVAHTCESVMKLIAPASLAQFSLDPASAIVVSAVPALGDQLNLALAAADAGVSVERVSFSGADGPNHQGRTLDQATALALGLIIDNSRIPTIDLAVELEAEYHTILDAKNRQFVAKERQRVTMAKAALWAPFVLIASVLLTSYVDSRRESSRLSEETTVAEQRAAALIAEAALRVTAKQHFTDYVTLTEQTLELRRRQPATAQLLNDLNQQWPAGDASWFISEMKTTGGGSIELKGRTMREESVTAFTRGLEFSNGLFTNVSNNLQTAPSAAGETGKTAPLEFIVRAVYTPLKKTSTKEELQ